MLTLDRVPPDVMGTRPASFERYPDTVPPGVVAWGPFVIESGPVPGVGSILRVTEEGERTILHWDEGDRGHVVTLRRAWAEGGKIFLRTDAGRFIVRAFRPSDRRWLEELYLPGVPITDPVGAVKAALGW